MEGVKKANIRMLLYLFTLLPVMSFTGCRHPFVSPADPNGINFLGQINVENMYPLEGITVPNTNPYFSWEELGGAEKYYVQLAESLEALESAEEIETETTSLELENSLTSGKTYYWRVRPADENGNKGLFSEVKTFTAGVYSVEGLNAALVFIGLDMQIQEIIPANAQEIYRDMTITSYGLADIETTQSDWALIRGEPFSYEEDYGTGENYPVYGVSYNDVVEFCNSVSAYAGLSPVYYFVPEETIGVTYYPSTYLGDFTKTGFFVPTEAQWEFAAGGPAHSTWPLGDTYVADDYVDSYTVTETVKSKTANGFGLYHMGGNVAEFCSDFFISFPHSGETDPVMNDKKYRIYHRTQRGSPYEYSSKSPDEYLKCEYRPSTWEIDGTAAGFRLAAGGFGKWN